MAERDAFWLVISVLAISFLVFVLAGAAGWDAGGFYAIPGAIIGYLGLRASAAGRRNGNGNGRSEK